MRKFPEIDLRRDIFISYSSNDKSIADGMCHYLEHNKIKCWVAPRDAVPGVSYAESIVRGIESSRIMVLIFTKSSNLSGHVKRELELAVENEVPIIPFRIDNIEPCREIKYYIKKIHWLDAFSEPLDSHFINLHKTIKKLLSMSEEEDTISTRNDYSAYDSRFQTSQNRDKKIRSTELNVITRIERILGEVIPLRECLEWGSMGITIEEEHVVRLVISNKKLRELPAELGDLQYLRLLGLVQNKLGNLPASIKNLTQLEKLDLSLNSFYDLPEELWLLKELTVLSLGGNNLIHIPSEIENIKYLTWFNCEDNKISEFPESLTHLQSLSYVKMRKNRIEQIPQSIIHLTQLRYLDISSNRLSTLPPNLHKLTSLQTLDARWNHFTSLPTDVEDSLQKLEKRGVKILL